MSPDLQGKKREGWEGTDLSPTVATHLRRRVRRYSHLLGVNVKTVGGSHQRYGAVCSANQCHNRATCVVDDYAVGGFRCQCVRGFYGLHCDNGVCNALLSLNILKLRSIVFKLVVILINSEKFLGLIFDLIFDYSSCGSHGLIPYIPHIPAGI
jgi:hypothetical protein